MTWQTLEKELHSPHFYNYILGLKDKGTLKDELPEVYALIDIPERLDYHPEGNSFDHTILTLKQVQYYKDPSLYSIINFCMLCHDLGKALTPKDILPKHIGHDTRGLSVINSLCNRLEVPENYRHIALYVCMNHMDIFTIPVRKPSKLYKFVKSATYDFTSFDDLSTLLICSKCDVLGRLGKVNDKADSLKFIYLLCRHVFNWAQMDNEFYTEQEQIRFLNKSLPLIKQELSKSLTDGTI